MGRRRTSCFISFTLNWKGILTMILKGPDAGGRGGGKKYYLDEMHILIST